MSTCVRGPRPVTARLGVRRGRPLLGLAEAVPVSPAPFPALLAGALASRRRRLLQRRRAGTAAAPRRRRCGGRRLARRAARKNLPQESQVVQVLLRVLDFVLLFTNMKMSGRARDAVNHEQGASSQKSSWQQRAAQESTWTVRLAAALSRRRAAFLLEACL